MVLEMQHKKAKKSNRVYVELKRKGCGEVLYTFSLFYKRVNCTIILNIVVQKV